VTRSQNIHPRTFTVNTLPTSPINSPIVIIGAGPAGLLLAHYLRRRGCSIEIFDRRPDPRQITPNEQRSFPLSLQDRGRIPLQTIPGLEAAIARHGVFCCGTTVHDQRKTRDIPRKNSVLTVDRNRLVIALLEHLTATYPDITAHLHFEHHCQQVDCAAQTVTFHTPTGDRVVAFDRLIGADGARSQVRSELVDRHNLPVATRLVVDAYRSLYLRRTNPAQGVNLADNRIHASNAANDCRIILAPQPGDQLQGAFIFNHDRDPLAGKTTPEEVFAVFEKLFPAFLPLLEATEARELLDRPVARLLTVRCEQFHHGDRVLLLGDAAHAVSPSIGQGCNASLEDVAILNALLDVHHDNWSAVIPAFSAARVADAHALQDLSDYSFPRSKKLVVEFFLRLTLGRLLHRWFPQWVKPFVFDLVLDSHLSYGEVLAQSQGWIDKVKRSMQADPKQTPSA